MEVNYLLRKSCDSHFAQKNLLPFFPLSNVLMKKNYNKNKLGILVKIFVENNQKCI